MAEEFQMLMSDQAFYLAMNDDENKHENLALVILSTLIT